MGRAGGTLTSHRESALSGAGGLRIYWQCWAPEPPPRAIIVIAHGGGEHSGRYEHVAARLVSEGYAVYAIDHRGHGRSDGARAVIDRIANAVGDLDSLVQTAGAEHRGTPIFLIGHSVGGLIAVAYARAHQQRLAGLILSGPLAALEAASPLTRIAGKLLSAIAPGLPLIAIDASLVSRDPDVVARYVADPLVHHGKLPARTVAELTAAVESFPAAAPAITVPTLITYGTADALAPPKGSLMLYERLGASDKTLKPYEGLAHEIFNEPEQQQVLDDMCRWLAERAPGVQPAAASSSSSDPGDPSR